MKRNPAEDGGCVSKSLCDWEAGAGKYIGWLLVLTDWTMFDETRRHEIEDALLSYRKELERDPERNASWKWLEGGPRTSPKAANKFLLRSYINYRWRDSVATDKVVELVEKELGDPDNLWARIREIPFEDWYRSYSDRPMHSTPARHEGVWHLAVRMGRLFQDDATKLWREGSLQITRDRISDELLFGDQMTRMTVGALWDEELVTGVADVKADLHVRRVVGRLCAGRELSASEATNFTRELHSANPWLLDWPLFEIGGEYCLKSGPKCAACPVRQACTLGGGRPIAVM